MKRLISILLSLIFIFSLSACSNNTVNTDTQTEAEDTSIKISDSEKERREETELGIQNPYISKAEDGYYSVIRCGKYLGNDFKNTDYYENYYRIIDNYEDFCSLTQIGSQYDKEIFNEYSVLVIHRYTYNIGNYGIKFYGLKKAEHYVYNVHLEIWEELANDYLPDIPGEVRQTIYLLIPNSDIPQNVEMNGEISICTNTIE